MKGQTDVKIGFHTFAGGYDLIPLSTLRTHSGVRSLQFKACFTAEATGGVRSQLSHGFAAVGDEVAFSLWILTSDGCNRKKSNAQ